MKNFQTLVLALACICLNAYSNNEIDKKKQLGLPNEMPFVSESIVALSNANDEIKTVMAQLNEAKKSKKAVFLVVYKDDDESSVKALKIANEASKNSITTEVIKMSISDSENLELVNKFRLSGAPLPVILVIDKNGNAAGGLPLAQATPEALIRILPSPAFSQVIKAMNDQKTNFVIAYKESMMGKEKALAMCKEAVAKLNNTAVITELNIDDKAEVKLLNNLKVNTLTTEPIIYVVNKQGQVTATFKTLNTSDELVTAAKTVKKSGGCCPGGSKKGGC